MQHCMHAVKTTTPNVEHKLMPCAYACYARGQTLNHVHKYRISAQLLFRMFHNEVFAITKT